MALHLLKRENPNKKHVQVGRGGKRGKTSGRGTKGQKARAGHRMRPEIRDMIKKIPKLRGHGKNRGKSNYLKPTPIVVNLAALELAYDTGATVSPTTLFEKGIINSARRATKVIKILGTGDITKSLTIEACEISATAKSKVEAAGGKVV
jgi:large subunit ribosomal protein L15